MCCWWCRVKSLKRPTVAHFAARKSKWVLPVTRHPAECKTWNKPHSAHWLSFNSRQLIIEANMTDLNGASTMNYGFTQTTLCKKINKYFHCLYHSYKRENIWKTNPLDPFWEQLLRAPFAAAGQRERLVHYRQSGRKKSQRGGGGGEKNASARSLTVGWAPMARLPEHHPECSGAALSPNAALK